MQYAIVFDMDETLGFFKQINYLWHLLKSNNKEITNKDFNNILDLYPEYLRPNILELLTFLKSKKMAKLCSNIIIYTNNKTSLEWITLIQKYFNNKVNYNLFDKTIGPFKIKEKILEKNRTSYKKSYEDLLRCTNFYDDVKICFIDDKMHKDMINKNVVYIKIKPYTYELNKDIIFYRLYRLYNNNSFLSRLKSIENNYKYINENINSNYDIHNIITKKIIIFINNFLNNKNKTLKIYKIYNNKTKKLINI